MAVTNLVNAMAPSGISGPPEVMAGFATLDGDGSAGTSSISIQLDAGFLWMPNYVSFGTGDVTALEFFVSISSMEDSVGGGTNLYRVSGTIPVKTAVAVSETVVFPRMLIKTNRGAASVNIINPNVDGDTVAFFLRALRWPKNAEPAAWTAFMVAPP